MDIGSDGPKPVSSWVRVLAWVIVLASVVAGAGVILQLSSGRPLGMHWYELAVLVVAVAWTLPLFWIVALTGRVPRHWLGLGTQLWRTGVTTNGQR